MTSFLWLPEYFRKSVMKSITIEQIFNSNNNSKSNDEISSQETNVFMQNQRNTEKWYSDALSSTIISIIERHEQINDRLQKTSIADILAGIQLDNKSKDRAPLKEVTVGRQLYTDGLTDTYPTLSEPYTPDHHLTTGNNKISDTLCKDKKGEAKVWKDISVFYNNPFDPRITFKGIQLQDTTKNKKEQLSGYPDTFNSFLDIVNPSGFANSYLHTYQQYLRDLRNESRQLAQDDPCKNSDHNSENKLFDKIESELHSSDERVHDAPCYVGNECENIDMWSQIMATRRLWSKSVQLQENTNINDDNATKSLLVALFSNSTEDLHSNQSKQEENEPAGSERSETGSYHLQPEQRCGIHESQAKSAAQSRILPHLLSLYNSSDSKTPQVLPDILNQGDAQPIDYNIDENIKTPSNVFLNNLSGCEDAQTNNVETEETFWTPTEAGDFVGVSFVPPFNPWSTVHVDYLDKPIVAAQTSMFWSHQQRCRQKQQQQQSNQESQSQADQPSSDKNKQGIQEQQESQHQSSAEQIPKIDCQKQQQQHQQQQHQQQQQQQLKEQHHHHHQEQIQHQCQMEELYYRHNEQNNHQQLQQQQLFQNQYQNQVQHAQIQQQQMGRAQQQQLEHPTLHPHHLRQQQLHEQQSGYHQQYQQQHLQNNYQQKHQYNSQIHHVNQMPPVYQQQYYQQQQQTQPPPKQQIQLNPNQVLLNQQCNVQNQRNKAKHDNIQLSTGQEQWSGIHLNNGQTHVPAGYTSLKGGQHNLSQQSVNVQQPQNYAQNTGRPVYQTNGYYPSIYPQYSTSTSMDGGLRSTNHPLNCNHSYLQSPGVAQEQVLNQNFIQSRPQPNYVQFDDEVWYINGIPHQHAKPVQSNENVELPPNTHYWPQMFGPVPNVAPPRYTSAQSYQGMSTNGPGVNVKNANHQSSYNTQFQNMCPNNNINNNSAVGDDNTEFDIVSETWSVGSLTSSRSQHSLYKLSDDMTENSRESYISETQESLSELSDAEGEEDWFDARDNLGIVGISNDYQYDADIDNFDSCKIKKTEEFVGRRIKVLSGRSKANRERQYPQRKLRNNRSSHLIKII